MLRRDNIKLIVIAAACLAVGLSAPAIGHGVHAQFAHNSDKVDGKHAVGSGAGLNKAKGKLVAHNGGGKLPAKFIPKVKAAKQADNTKRVNGLPAKTLTGQFYVMGPASGSGQFLGNGISFGFSLPSVPVKHFVNAGADVTVAQCPGTFAAPAAAPGHLCAYEGGSSNTTVRGLDQVTASGAGVFIQANGAGHTFSYGTWAVTPGTAALARSGDSASNNSPTG